MLQKNLHHGLLTVTPHIHHSTHSPALEEEELLRDEDGFSLFVVMDPTVGRTGNALPMEAVGMRFMFGLGENKTLAVHVCLWGWMVCVHV